MIVHLKVFILAILMACTSRNQNSEALLSLEKPLNAGFLLVQGVYNTELMAPMDIFQHTTYHTNSGIKVFTVAPSLDPISTFEGLTIIPDFTFSDSLLPAIDILVVPSAENSMGSDLVDTLLIDFVRKKSQAATYTVSLCDGAFILAKADLLNGISCTTFPKDIDRLKEMFPSAEVYKGVSFVHHGNFITSVGGAKSYDPALYLVDMIFGEKVAKNVAEGLVIDWEKSNYNYKTVL